MPSFTKGFNFEPKVCYASTIRKLFTLLYPFYFFAGNHCQTSRDTTTSGCSCRGARGRVSPPARYGDFLDIYANVRHVDTKTLGGGNPASISGLLARSAIASLLRKPEQQALESIPLAEISRKCRARHCSLAETGHSIRSPRRINSSRTTKETGRAGARAGGGGGAASLFRQKGFNF
jgi:hypothetical protein